MSVKNYKKLLVVPDKVIHSIAKYDKKAFEQLYNQTSGAVFGLAMSILANQSDADDVVQETYISVYNNASKYKGKGKAMAWIFTIARNHALMKIRDRQKRSHINLDDVYDVGVENNLEDDLHKEQLVDILLKTLKEDERQIVIMHAMSNMKHKEIAEIMDMPLSTVLSKYKRSLQKLRNVMEVNEYEK
jgi:RNA polymerase sigma-70 factor (ECF subfamily)